MPGQPTTWPRKTRELHNHHFDSTVWNDLAVRDSDIIVASYAKAALDLGDDVIIAGVDKRYAQLVSDRLWWFDANTTGPSSGARCSSPSTRSHTNTRPSGRIHVGRLSLRSQYAGQARFHRGKSKGVAASVGRVGTTGPTVGAGSTGQRASARGTPAAAGSRAMIAGGHARVGPRW